MNKNFLERVNDYEWHINPTENMRVPGIIYASDALAKCLDEHVLNQIRNVASLRGIVKASYAMPDAHWGYGFPIGGVAAFDPDEGGVISAGGVGFDISCGVRSLTTGLTFDDIFPIRSKLADKLFSEIPSGLGKRSKSKIYISEADLDALLTDGAVWAIQQGYGINDDLLHTEEMGRVQGATPEYVSKHAKQRQIDEIGTLGSGNHYLEIQVIKEIYDTKAAIAFNLKQDDILISIHCGSRGLGHQIGTEYLRQMALEAASYGIELPDRELACVPIKSPTGERYLGVMRAAINCALANRQVLTHLLRVVFYQFFTTAKLQMLFDVSHNTCKVEDHYINGKLKTLYVHRKGATRALGPGHPSLPADLRHIGQPVLVGGSMGTNSYVLVGTNESENLSFASSCHGAGRAISRHQAKNLWKGREIVKTLANRGIEVRSLSFRGVAEEAPEAYKNIDEVINSADHARLSTKVAKLAPIICIKG